MVAVPMSNSLSETSSTNIIGPRCDFVLTLLNANNKGADKLVHPCNLITFVHAHWLMLSEIYPGMENLILPMLSYPGRQVTSSCEIAS